MHRISDWTAVTAVFLFLATGCANTDEGEADEPADAGTVVQEAEAFRLTVPQNDLEVDVDGFRIIPPMGMGSWAAFAPAENGSEMLVMGDVVVLEDEVGPVQQALVDRGLTVTGLHNHFVREEPDVMYMHIRGTGPRDALEADVRAVFDRVAGLRGGDPSEANAVSVDNGLDTDRISEILGHPGEMNRGVYRVTIGRPDVDLTSDGTTVTTDMGFNTWAAWQGEPDEAAVAGDFVMLEDEVEPVIETLVSNGIEVVAVHNHMVHEEPRAYFLHYWGTGVAEEMAFALREALDQQG